MLMNHQSNLKRRIFSIFLTSILLVSCSSEARHKGISSTDTDPIGPDPEVLAASMTPAKKKIKIALLLDTSNSMDGLIDQAKAQLWRIVNELALAKCDNEKPDLEIALYEYGNNALSPRNGYVKQVAMFTKDLDLISEKLFGLRTNGGEEYCGYVISSACKELEWSNNRDDLQLMFIAGNESFNQGPVDTKNVFMNTKEKSIVVNTIYCGEYNQGISEGWKSGAILAKGNYMSIEQDRKTVYIETPYDDQIGALNKKLNNTYIGYGYLGEEKKANQEMQDKNAETYGSANVASRALTKSSSLYSNSNWDLVDASKDEKFDIVKLDESELPAELKNKSAEEKKQYINEKAKEREVIVKQINDLNVKRSAFIAEKSKTSGSDEQSLDAVMIKAIREQAAQKNFVFEL